MKTIFRGNAPSMCTSNGRFLASFSYLEKSFESPITVFVAREHHIKDKSYSEITREGEDIIIKVIGIRYQLNDDFVSILGELDKIVGMKKLNIRK